MPAIYNKVYDIIENAIARAVGRAERQNRTNEWFVFNKTKTSKKRLLTPHASDPARRELSGDLEMSLSLENAPVLFNSWLAINYAVVWRYQGIMEIM